MHLFLRRDEDFAPEAVQRRLVYMLYERNDISFHRGTFRVRGDVIEIFPVHEEERAIRVEFFGDTVESIQVIDPLRGAVLEELCRIYRLSRQPLRHLQRPVADRQPHHQGRTARTAGLA